MRLQTLEHVQSHAWSTKTTQEFDHIHQDGFLWLVVISLLKRLAITCDYSTLSVVYEAPSKWIKFVWHEIELLSFFWRDRPYRFKVFGTIRTIPNLHHVEISYGFLPKCVFPKKIAIICSDGEKRRIGLTGPPPLHLVKGSGSLQSRRARMSIMNVMHLKVMCFFFVGGPIVLQSSVHVWNHVYHVPAKLIFYYFDCGS